ncbi:MAG TPA: Gldg family protein [Burkholderiales bacterium]|nr:Gldg family protein [Burkholderiales bacterium]
MRKYESLVYSAVGLAALFLILVAFNYLASATALRADLTAGKLYTLSDGTRKILHGLESPVTLKLYSSRGDAVPVPLRSFTQRVQDMVERFKAVAGPKLQVQVYHPTPDSEEEDAAQLDGIEAQQLASGDNFYLGVSVSRLDRKEVIPAITPQREQLLEYDLSRAIAGVASSARIKLGLMSALPVLGEQFNPMTRSSSDPWVLAGELKREFDVEPVDMTAPEIPKDIGVLLLIHPRDITPQGEYALDQFVLRGGKLIAFVDPYAYFDQLPSMPGMPAQGGTSSTLPTLFKAWGVDMDPGKVIADTVYASGNGPRYTPTVLSLNRTAFNRSDVVTSQLETLLYAFGGAFKVNPASGLKATDLVTSSADSMLVDDAKATVAGDAATKDFVPGGVALPLALRLSGKFKTAFPGGRPAAPGEKPDASKKAAEPQLRESAKDNSVILVADTDMLQDPAAVDVQDVLGHKVVVPSNGNLAFALDMVEQFAGGDDLISLRSRASSFRPLTVVRELEANAQKQYFGKIRALEDELQKTTDKLQELQKAQGPSARSAQILSAEQQAELEKFRKEVAQTKLELKEVRKNLRRDSEALVFWTKLANIALMPFAIALFGLGVALVRRRRTA